MTGIPQILGLARPDRKSRQNLASSTGVIEFIPYPAG
jgi:hypothetical protein